MGSCHWRSYTMPKGTFKQLWQQRCSVVQRKLDHWSCSTPNCSILFIHSSELWYYRSGGDRPKGKSTKKWAWGSMYVSSQRAKSSYRERQSMYFGVFRKKKCKEITFFVFVYVYVQCLGDGGYSQCRVLIRGRAVYRWVFASEKVLEMGHYSKISNINGHSPLSILP